MRRVIIVFLVGVPLNLIMLTKLTIEMEIYNEEYENYFEHIAKLEEEGLSDTAINIYNRVLAQKKLLA